MKEDTGANNCSSIAWEAVIFDLDGVVTDTAGVHARAWKDMFDSYLDSRKDRDGDQESVNLRPFDPDEDYRRYVDGKPRYDGVADFLASRNISLPFGRPDDPPDRETVCGLGNRKNQLFREYLQKQGVTTYKPVVDLIRRLRSAGIKTAVVSSSKNCGDVLATAGISDIFDIRVDGKTAQELQLKGKPAPDIFLKAAEKLGVEPARAVVVEDAVSGVKAGRSGGFGCVIGMDRDNAAESLKRNGAHRVVADGVKLEAVITGGTRSTTDLPSALSSQALAIISAGRKPVVFLDFDGTLSPIVDRPDEAVLPQETTRTLSRLKELCRVAIISGRDLKDVRDRAGIDGLYYAGSHGFDIIDPDRKKIRVDQGVDALPALEAAEKELEDKLKSFDGLEVERKKFSIAVHFRRVAAEDVDEIEAAVDQVRQDHPELRKKHGKKIFELQPDVDWHKGKAVRHLLAVMGLDKQSGKVLPIYIGDDVTDEDAFQTLRLDGVGIVVHDDEPKQTHAVYVLSDPEEVEQFLNQMISTLEGRRK